jgi:hypothetical protein
MKNGRAHQASIIAKTVIAGTVLAVAFYTGTFFGQNILEQQAKATTLTPFNPTVETRLVQIRTIRYVEIPGNTTTRIEPPQTVERVENDVEEIRNFADVDELKTWLNNRGRTTSIIFEQTGAAIDCDDFALELQREALEDGYMVNFQIIEPGSYNSLFEDMKIPDNTLHAINLVIIGNRTYYIEPQTAEIVLTANID